MYVTSVSLENVRSILELEWSIPPDKAAGWHVVVGDNGSGKSSFLRALALGLIGDKGWSALRQVSGDWVTRDAPEARIRVEIVHDPTFDEVGFVRPGDRAPLPERSITIPATGSPTATITPSDPLRGWFSAAYGPFRRFTGGDPDYERTVERLPRVARHLSIFDERVALTESLTWLRDLKFKTLEKDPQGTFLEPLTRFLNEGQLLPHGVKLAEITSSDITFVDGNDYRVPIQQLSDGYRSILSLTLDLLRQLSISYGPERVFDANDPSKVACPGVVIIDEVDVHLHPTWQRSIGIFFREHFPKMQFIVSSHSPLVCQAAELGTVFRLPRPSDNEPARMIEGVELERLLYGSVLDAYGTEIFGRGVTRSEKSQEYMRELADLNQRELQGRLQPEERQRQHHLRSILPSTAYDRDDLAATEPLKAS